MFIRQTLNSRILHALLFCGLITATTGCVTYTHHAIPADRLPDALKACSKADRTPINIALLGQKAPRVHVLGAGDVVSVYIQGILPAGADQAVPVVRGTSALQRDVYPPSGQINSPSLGVPLDVNQDGSLNLPSLGSIAVAGLTIQQAADKIAKLVVESGLRQEGKEYVTLDLVKSRLTRVVVIRQEVQSPNQTLIRREQQVLSNRGYANILDLPVYENDVLHALTATGGLPGIEAHNEVWVLRQQLVEGSPTQEIWEAAESGADPSPLVQNLEPFATAKRIPLWTYGSANPCMTQEDVILQDGDIVYVKPRDDEYFYVGGLLPGAAIPLPRDRDIDIVEAISIANGSIGGPGGTSGLAVFRSGAGPGNVIPPTRALIVRKLPNNQQIAIRVDLARSLRDPEHRPLIQPGDFVTLNFKPGEVFTNAALNFFNFTIISSN